jgi:hypothetical protein
MDRDREGEMNVKREMVGPTNMYCLRHMLWFFTACVLPALLLALGEDGGLAPESGKRDTNEVRLLSKSTCWNTLPNSVVI